MPSVSAWAPAVCPVSWSLHNPGDGVPTVPTSRRETEARDWKSQLWTSSVCSTPCDHPWQALAGSESELSSRKGVQGRLESHHRPLDPDCLWKLEASCWGHQPHHSSTIPSRSERSTFASPQGGTVCTCHLGSQCKLRREEPHPHRVFHLSPLSLSRWDLNLRHTEGPGHSAGPLPQPGATPPGCATMDGPAQPVPCHSPCPLWPNEGLGTQMKATGMGSALSPAQG